jgi:radical SAM superfamily enzyme YgiQ (UPF0313 family)
MRILLVNPTTRNYGKGITIAAAAPLGLLSLAAVLRDDGHNIRIYDHNVENNGLKECLKFEPDLVGVTSFTGLMIRDALDLSNYFHQRDIPVVWGGIHASLMPIQTVKDENIDMVVVGEGEETIVELADAMENKRKLDAIKGLVWTKNNGSKIVENTPRPLIKDLDLLPFPAWDLIDEKKYEKTLMGWESSSSEFFSIQTSRGCPYRCGFCYNTVFNARKWRAKSADRVIEELSFLKDNYNINRVNFRDDNFVVNRKRAIKICKEIYKNQLDVEFGIDCRADLLTENFAKILKLGGCDQIYFGIESGSPRILRFINKDITLQQAMDSVNICKKLGIKSSTSFILGFPTETKTDIQLTEKFIMKLMPDRLLVKIFVPYPGCKLYDYVVNKKIFTPPDKLEGWAFDWNNADFKLSTMEPKFLKNKLRRLYMNHFMMKLPKTVINFIKNSFTQKITLHKVILSGIQNLLNGGI